MKLVTRGGRPIAAAFAAAVFSLCGIAPAAAEPGAEPGAEPAQGGIANADAPDVIPNSYLVRLAEGVPATRVDELAAAYDATVTHRYRSLDGFAVAMPADRAVELAADPTVASVEADAKLSTTGTQPSPPWGLDRLDQASRPLDTSYTYPATGASVTAYVIDSGIRVTHTDFGLRARHGWDVIDGDTSADDGNGHGTHVAATIGGTTHGVAKDVDLVAVRALDDNGDGDVAGVVEAIDWVIEDVDTNGTAPAVINMSIGGGRSDQINDAVKAATEAGIVVVTSAGNESEDACLTSPASAPDAITVGASQNTDTMASFSNYGACVDVMAPGVGILSAWNTGDTATATKNGTSMASPHVAGAAALYLETHPAATPAQVRYDLVAAATAGQVTGLEACTTGRLLTVGLPAATPVGTDVAPAATGDLAAAESVDPGDALALAGTGFDPGTTVQYTMYPGAVPLGSGTVSPAGVIADAVTVPSGTTCDATVVATGTAPGGAARVLSARVAVTVTPVTAPPVTIPQPAPVEMLPVTGTGTGTGAAGIAATGTTLVLLGVAAILGAGYRRRPVVLPWGVTLREAGRHRVGR